MTDIAIQYDNSMQYGDLSMDGDDLLMDNGLESAVLISLFTDARADQDELPYTDADPRGWVFEDVDGITFGSKLWLLERSKLTSETLALAEDYARTALEWMLTDGVASEVEVSAIRLDGTILCLNVTISKNGKVLFNKLYEDLWSAQFGLLS